MKEKRKEMDESKITGFFDDGTEFNGDLKFRGSFRIDGNFKGKIDSDSLLIIGDKGKVEAEVHVGHVIINGEFKGNMQASERVEISNNGKVIGTIIAPKLVVEEGAYLEANCQTTDKIPPSPSKTKEESEK
ncbi:MAG: polymer-forming cytoskeletal protein [Candidatus Aminicenantales bacterium]